jgi:ABC-2 type transport system ATP-binding protein
MVSNYPPAVDVSGLSKEFVTGVFRKRRKMALRGVDLLIPKGAFWCLLGPNGAGKTTLLSILSNLLIADSGTIRILGMDMKTHSREIVRRINISSGHANFLWSMNVRENLNYYAMLYGLPKRRRRERIGYLMDLFSLSEHERNRFDELSTGTKQRLSLAKSLLNSPELLFLDEPSVGLDPDVAERIRIAIRTLHEQEGTTILMTTHNMREAEAMCEKAAFIVGGLIKAVGRPADLKRELKLGDTVEVFFSNAKAPLKMESWEGTYHFSYGRNSLKLIVDDHRIRLPLIMERLCREGIAIERVEVSQSDLEDVFLAIAR